jgi:hypothetical protein
MRRILIFSRMLLTAFGISDAGTTPAPRRMIFNPLNLSYRYMPDEPSRHETTDQTTILSHNDFYLFASTPALARKMNREVFDNRSFQ